MATQSTITLDPEGDDYVLRRTDVSGNVTSIFLCESDVIVLSQSALALKGHILSRHRLAGAAIDAVISTPVDRVGLRHETLGENILLTMTTPSDAQMTFAVPLEIADQLAKRLPVHLAEIRSDRLTKQ